MKQFLFILSFLAFSFYSKSQVAAGGCSSVTVVSIPSYPTVYLGNIQTSLSKSFCNLEGDPHCQIFVNGSSNVWQMHCLLTLQKFENQNWIDVQSAVGTSGYVFSVSTPGKYRVKILTPTIQENFCCKDALGNIKKAKTKIFNINGQFIGYRGTFDNSPFGGNYTYYTNEVFVGAAQPSDIQWSYIDGDGLDAGTNLFDFNEIVRINTAGTQNYTHWWLAIFELNGAMRYKSTGWNFGAMPSVINLTSFWNDNGSTNWKFENLTSYRVQLAISNQCNTQWTEMSPQPPDFFICPQGSGCRLGDEIVPITLAPNPASYQFSLQNLPASDVQVHVYDMSGRLVKNYQNSNGGIFDISELNNGIYFVRALQNSESLYNGKLSVVH